MTTKLAFAEARGDTDEARRAGTRGADAARERTERVTIPPGKALAIVSRDGPRVPLRGASVVLGSGGGCDVTIADRTVSARHCRFVNTREGWEVHDEGSTNGTWVEGVRVHAARVVAGVELKVGRTVLSICDDAENEPRTRGLEHTTEAEPIAPGVHLVGSDPAMARVRRDVARYAGLPYAALVRGETGAGKELIARALHLRSARAKGPFVAVNCAAIAPELVESELFGHERGAFTGAVARRKGFFEEAHGGTLFLDELGELPLSLQARLLRVLETGEVRRVGSERSVAVDVRVVAATHRDLAERVHAGHFRADLRYRLEMLVVRLPALRERRGDIPLLVRHLLARIERETGRRRAVDDAIFPPLVAYDWPGNVRELYGVLCRAVATAGVEPRLGLEHLDLHALAPTHARPAVSATIDDRRRTPLLPPPPAVSAANSVSPEAPLAAVYARIAEAPASYDARSDGLHGAALLALLDHTGGNLSRLSRATNLARSTLRDRIARARASTEGETIPPLLPPSDAHGPDEVAHSDD